MEDILGIDINITKNKQNSGTNTHQAEISNYQEFLSRREAKGADEATSLVTLLAELRLGEGSTFNSTTGKQLQELNNINCHAEFISASSHLQAVTTPETQNDHLQEHTGGQILKQVQDDYILRGRIDKQKVGGAHLRTDKRIDKQKRSAFTLPDSATHVANFAERRLGFHPNNVDLRRVKQKRAAFTSPSKGMSEAKVEQQSTETLSFRCWCERCRLTRGRRVKQSRATELGWGEGATFNSVTAKQLQKPNNETNKKVAFTLAEVLITLGIIGVVAAMTLPVLLTNVQAKIRAEQIRSAKYKFSLATEKMARLNLIGPYDSTDAFVDELQKHLKISKRCNASNLRDCWPYDTVDLGNGKTWDISKTKTGSQLGMETDDKQDYSSNNVGIVTADGVPMILSYNKKCPAIDSLEKLSWSTTDNKPETNDSAGCVAAVFEINGTGKPNKLSNDVVLFNAGGLGNSCGIEVSGKCLSAVFSPTPLTYEQCVAQKSSLGIHFCAYSNDYWAGAAAKCGGVNNIASPVYLYRLLYKNNKFNKEVATSLGLPDPPFGMWAGNGAEISAYGAHYYEFGETDMYWRGNDRIRKYYAVCLQ